MMNGRRKSDVRHCEDQSRTAPDGRPRAVAGGGAVITEAAPPRPRQVFGRLLANARSFEFAVATVRLASLDIRGRDVVNLESARVLVGNFDNRALLDAVDAARGVGERVAALRELARILSTGRTEIRSAGVWRWYPDFCIATGPPLERWFDRGAAGLVGYLGLGDQPSATAPRVACLVSGARSLDPLRKSFDELWDRGHDVTDVVIEALGGGAIVRAR